MDIYEYAKIHNADYLDMSNGRIFKVQEYNNCIRLGLPQKGIRVVTLEGEFVGYAQKKEN